MVIVSVLVLFSYHLQTISRSSVTCTVPPLAVVPLSVNTPIGVKVVLANALHASPVVLSTQTRPPARSGDRTSPAAKGGVSDLVRRLRR